MKISAYTYSWMFFRKITSSPAFIFLFKHSLILSEIIQKWNFRILKMTISTSQLANDRVLQLVIRSGLSGEIQVVFIPIEIEDNYDKVFA